MHHFIYPTKDTFITNLTGLDAKNFGLSEILQVGSLNVPIRILSPTKNYVYVNAIFTNQSVTFFTGTFTGSFSGSVQFASGSISGSNLIFSASYFSGSVNNTSSVFSGSVSGSLVNGFITGSIIAQVYIGLFTGFLTGSSCCLTGTGSGIDTRNEINWTTTTAKFVDRALLKFDFTIISQSIVNGSIPNPQFTLKLKASNEFNLPITYTIYALPISQSWNMGDGFFSDGGSDTGASWDFRDFNAGTPWYNTFVSGARPAIDFISNPALVTASFGYGGGTWYTSSYASQSFNYEAADIRMNLNPMVMAWISGTIPNEGLLLIQSDELVSTGSGLLLKFFSRDTNTVYSPYIDLAWSDAAFSTGSFFTSSVQIVTTGSGASMSVQSGSSLNIAGGVSGSFSGSTFLNIVSNYITASNSSFISQTTSKFTGSFSGSFFLTASYVTGTLSGSSLIFSSDYFSGSVDGVSFVSSGSISGSLVNGFVSGSVSSTFPIGLFTGTMTSSLVFLNGTGSGFYLDPTYLAFSGFTSGNGLTGNIQGIPVFGFVNGIITITSFLVTGSCGASFYTQLATASFINGPFSGSTFTAFYVGDQFENAILTGSWTGTSLLSASVSIPIPSGFDPYAYATITGQYINGVALGKYTLDGPGSASFNGQMINGTLLGGYINLQLTGSIYTSSFSYTGSVQISSSFLNPLDTAKPFSINVQNLQPTYKAGDIIRIDIFGRKKFPLKFFGISTQQEQYLIPEFLPSSSYYGLKDNLTDEVVIDFDSYTQISCEYPNGNYFLLDTTGLQQERYYRVLIRVQNGTEIYTIDGGKTFKIIR